MVRRKRGPESSSAIAAGSAGVVGGGHAEVYDVERYLAHGACHVPYF